MLHNKGAVYSLEIPGHLGEGAYQSPWTHSEGWESKRGVNVSPAALRRQWIIANLELFPIEHNVGHLRVKPPVRRNPRLTTRAIEEKLSLNRESRKIDLLSRLLSLKVCFTAEPMLFWTIGQKQQVSVPKIPWPGSRTIRLSIVLVQRIGKQYSHWPICTCY